MKPGGTREAVVVSGYIPGSNIWIRVELIVILAKICKRKAIRLLHCDTNAYYEI